MRKERYSQLVLSASNPLIGSLAVLADDSGEPDKCGVLYEPRYERVRHFHEAVSGQVHGPYLALEVPDRHFSRSGRLRVVRHGALGRG